MLTYIDTLRDPAHERAAARRDILEIGTRNRRYLEIGDVTTGKLSTRYFNPVPTSIAPTMKENVYDIVTLSLG